jgi:pimeloyl-ACP methyl ester carboxylesterase
MSEHAPLSPGSHTVAINGLEQRYHVAGSGPVCILHSGGPGVASEYLRTPALERHFTTVSVEPIGTGESARLPTHPSGYSVERYAEMLHGLIEHLAVPKVFVLGHSHGGFVAQAYALAHPERLAGIVLYDSAPAAGEELFAAATHRVAAFAALHAGVADAQAVADTWKVVGGIADDAGYTDALQKLLPVYFADYWNREHEFEPIRRSIRAWHVTAGGAPFDNRDRLGAIETPTLVIVGEHDFICGRCWAAVLRDEIPGAELVTFSDSGHFAHLEETEKFVAAIASFARTAPK